MSKRAYCTQLSKEDACRFRTSRPSLTDAVRDDEELAELSRVLTAKVPKDITHLRTVDAWMRRASSVRLRQLQRAVEKHVLPDDASVGLQGSRTEGSVPNKPSDSAPDPATEPERRDKAASVLTLDTSLRRNAASVVSVGNREEHSVVGASPRRDATHSVISADAVLSASNHRPPSHTSRGDGAATAPHTASTQSEVPIPPSSVPTGPGAVGFPPDDDAMSRLSIGRADNRSAVGTAVSLSSVSGLNKRPEEGINTWYSQKIGELEGGFEDGQLRHEQFKRKRALLRAEYWTKLDRVRNNATPTVIG